MFFDYMKHLILKDRDIQQNKGEFQVNPEISNLRKLKQTFNFQYYIYIYIHTHTSIYIYKNVYSHGNFWFRLSLLVPIKVY